MKHTLRTLEAIGLCVLLALALPGCERARYPVTGKVTRAGKPLEWKSVPLRVDVTVTWAGWCPIIRVEQNEQAKLLVTFVPFDRKGGGKVYRADTNTQAGTYAVTVPAGKYRIALWQLDPSPKHDVLNLKYSIRDSPVVLDVPGAGELNIDLPRELPNGAAGGGG